MDYWWIIRMVLLEWQLGEQSVHRFWRQTNLGLSSAFTYTCYVSGSVNCLFVPLSMHSYVGRVKWQRGST